MAVLAINDGVWKTEITYTTTGPVLNHMEPYVIDLLSKWERWTMFAPITHFLWDTTGVANTWKFEITRSDVKNWKQNFFGVAGATDDPEFNYQNFDNSATNHWSRREAAPYRPFRESVLNLAFLRSTVFATKITIDKL